MKEILEIETENLAVHSANKIYSNLSERLEGLKMDVKANGILTPLIIVKSVEEQSRFDIVSGASRFIVGCELGLKSFPTILVEISESEIDAYIVSANKNRVKLASEIAKEMVIMRSHFERKKVEEKSIVGKEPHDTRKMMADYFNMAQGQIPKYELLLKNSPELLSQVDVGILSINKAHEQCEARIKNPSYESSSLFDKVVEPQPCCKECGRPLPKVILKKQKKNEA